MKKRCLFLFTILCLCAGLTACANPLSELPEADGENIYNEGEGSTGNALIDEITDELMEERALYGDLVSVTVNDRDDNEESGEQSDLYIEIITESDVAEYVYYFIVSCRYSGDRGWRMKEYELDGEKESVMNVLTTVTEDDVKDLLESYVSSAKFGDTTVNFDEGEFTDITITAEEITPGVIVDSGVLVHPVEDLSVTFTWKNDFYSFTRDIDLQCRNYDAWVGSNWSFSEDYTIELSDETKEALSDERMLADLRERALYLGGRSVELTEDMIASYTFEEYKFPHEDYPSSDMACVRRAEILLRGSDIYTVSLIASYSYLYNESNWSCFYVMTRLLATDQNIAGNYSGIVYNASGEPYAAVYYSFTEVNDDGTLSGAVKWVPDGEDAGSIETVPFSGMYYMDAPYIYVTFDEEIETGRDSYMNFQYLYYDPETERLVGEDNGRSYALSK